MYAAYAVAAFCAARGMTEAEAEAVYSEIKKARRAAVTASGFYRDVELAIATVKANR